MSINCPQVANFHGCLAITWWIAGELMYLYLYNHGNNSDDKGNRDDNDDARKNM
jgi:hypothetical protein